MHMEGITDALYMLTKKDKLRNMLWEFKKHALSISFRIHLSLCTIFKEKTRGPLQKMLPICISLPIFSLEIGAAIQMGTIELLKYLQ